MFDKLISKISAKHYKKTSAVLLYIGIFTGLYGVLGVNEALSKTREQTWFFITKVIDVPFEERMSTLVLAISLLVIAIVCLVLAWKIVTTMKLFARYDLLIRNVQIIELIKIANMRNTTPRKVATDLQNMIDSGYISNYYIDYQKKVLVNQNIDAESIETITVKCPHCGAKTVIVSGNHNRCEYCDSAIN